MSGPLHLETWQKCLTENGSPQPSKKKTCGFTICWLDFHQCGYNIGPGWPNMGPTRPNIEPRCAQHTPNMSPTRRCGSQNAKLRCCRTTHLTSCWIDCSFWNFSQFENLCLVRISWIGKWVCLQWDTPSRFMIYDHVPSQNSQYMVGVIMMW
jgi:hypothetical protein